MNREKTYKHLSLLTWLSILALWFLVTNLNLISPSKLPSPQKVLAMMGEIFVNGYNYIPFWNHLGISFFRLVLAIFLAFITAIPLGLVCGYFPATRAIVNSLVNFYRPLPPLAYYSLLIVWLGIDEASKVTLLFLASFAPIYISSVSAVSRVNRSFILGAETFGASRWQIFCTVILPSTFPEIFVGIRTAFGVAYTTLVSAEMIAATAGIGWMVIDAYKYLKMDVVFVGIIIMGITGVLIDYLLTLVEKKVIFWNGQ